MKVSDFDFDLPEDRIAHHPVEPRDACKLLQVSKFFFDFQFSQLPDLLNEGDVLVLNDSKVIPARLFAQKGDTQIELLLHKPYSSHEPAKAVDPIDRSHSERRFVEKNSHEPPKGVEPSERSGTDRQIVGNNHWLAFAKPGKKLKVGDVLTIADGFEASVLAKHETGEVALQFNKKGGGFNLALEQYGHVPLPPYIKREDEQADHQHYQTVYARDPGSVAAPTAGLHFTPELLQRCRDRGIHIAQVTLHVGAGTFQPVKVEDTESHVMHSEWAEVTDETAQAINEARAGGGKVIAVGTTAMRTLESAADEDGILHPFCGETDIFITPGYPFKICDRLITNFHLPKSTLFMLIAAFSGLERMKAAYQHAIDSGYRFYSYGDACLLDRMSASTASMPHVSFL